MKMNQNVLKLLVILFLGLLFSTTEIKAQGLKASGKKIVDDKGNEVILRGMGLGGWMFNGMDPFSLLGASGNPAVPGLGFRYDTNEKWTLPNPTGLPGVFESYTPPHYRDMRHAVDVLTERKFGKGGPFHPDTPGYYKNTMEVRSRARLHNEEFKECVALQAQYIYDKFGKFPGTVPSVFVMPYLQAHHLDLEFYDHFYEKGSYLETHSKHMERWHPER